jgi:hypothetical protein
LLSLAAVVVDMVKAVAAVLVDLEQVQDCL